ncbi:general secretion pathway protein D [Nitrosospira multiformis ATCC 25196]|uniref:General secretion pathway protein D n=1 Tax=Nitrosospira multiformis (strain ATCC 25196 / NCIMB 11849 / C 71) TaxID=323848 RepID=Q2Y5U9_NITMU|nr:type II and III secretion system protein [Nitrosospira multiformis]ABB75872.1 type II and III secretion system protein [Nitrosospira multiformis ATCC 25196]SEF64416.1 general secretion pathway protein D [Nitrosospira multiformis ATCC 25196]
MKTGKHVLLALVLAGIAGCATNNAFVEGKRLIAEGKLDTGLASLEQAARENPDNLEIRAVLARQREAIAARFVFEAEAARSTGDLEAAERSFRRALEINPRHERALAGLEAINMDRRHTAAIKRAEELLERGEYAAASSEVRSVLQENPMQRDARRLIQRITEMEVQAAQAGPILKTAFKKPITLEFRDTGLKSVFEILARTGGINVVFDKDVKQDSKTTIFVRETNIEDVFKLLLVTNQLAHKVLNENSVLIYPNTPAKQKEYQELMVRSFFVTNTDVKQMVAMVKGLIKTKDMHVDEKLNLFVMKDTPEAIRLAERLVTLNDLADPEVMLEVEVLEIGRNKLLNLGLQYPEKINVNYLTAASAAGAAPFPPFQISRAGVNGNGSNLDNLIGFVANPALIVNLKQQDGLINVLANPRIRVKNREKAKVLIGDKVPVVTTTAAANVGVASSVSYLDVGLKLDVESTISLQDEVSMKVSLEVSNIVKEVPVTGGGLAYQVGTRTAATTLALKDGETQVLAGLISDDERTTLSKVPGLAELPWIGKLFINKNVVRNKTEIALLITPRIVRNIARPAKAVSEVPFGTENAIAVSPLMIGKVAPRALAMASSSPTSDANASRQWPSAPSREETRPPAPPEGAPVATLAAPEQVSAGQEFVVSVTLAGADALPPAELDLNYDPVALEPVDEGDKSGTRVLKLSKGGGAADVRFRILAQKPVTTQISIGNISFKDESGPLPVPVPLPPAVNVDIR